ncbi:Imm1 family immunity protein [Micromonospora antibiotica]|uniref:Uncharacterized protein n=1 Tax=Micromonospora antibiotica TaxID=2807623 RepID=A0ABS3V736_9ACTN|nr:Imm1 family immunity protein [Micromonospora antibiotica]MBO4161424.1 hypothetical protein [Micromonospora antibiotica]
MTYRVVFDICEQELPDAEAARVFLDKQTLMIGPHGTRAHAFWFAPSGADDVLRLDIDYDNARAALRWLPDGGHAVEQPPAEPIVVLESSDSPLVTIPAELAVLSVETAHRAVIEYIATGQRPSLVRWADHTASHKK